MSFSANWEIVNIKGKGPGKISHHKCAVFDDKMVLIGGLKGDDSNKETYQLDLKTHNWSVITAQTVPSNPFKSHRVTSHLQETTIQWLLLRTRSLYVVGSWLAPEPMTHLWELTLMEEPFIGKR